MDGSVPSKRKCGELATSSSVRSLIVRMVHAPERRRVFYFNSSNRIKQKTHASAVSYIARS